MKYERSVSANILRRIYNCAPLHCQSTITGFCEFGVCFVLSAASDLETGV